MALPGVLERFSGLRPCGGAEMEASGQLSMPDVSAHTGTMGGLSGVWGSTSVCAIDGAEIVIYEDVGAVGD